MKNINELTEAEAKDALDFVCGDKYHHFTGMSFEPVMDNGMQKITFDGRSIIGILYYNSQDNCVLHFDNTRMVLWLYKNGYDIEELLTENSHYSEMETDFQIVMNEIKSLAKGEESFREGFKQNWTLDYVIKKCSKIWEEYINKEY